MVVYLPGPVAVRLKAVDGATVQFEVEEEGPHRAALDDLLHTARKSYYALELRLVHYDGMPDAEQGRAARSPQRSVKVGKRTAPPNGQIDLLPSCDL